MRTNKIGVIYTCIFVGVFCVNSVWAEEKAAPPDPYANVQILVEAFVVEADPEALQEAGVNPIGQGPGEISITKLAACLVDESASVISGVKASARQGRTGKSQESKRIYLKRITKKLAVPQKNEPPVETISTTFESCNLGKKLEVAVRIVSDTAISTEYSYSESGITTDLENYDPNNFPPPNTYDYNWIGIVSLSPGRPVIAGAIQDEDSVVFLILTATVQNMPEVKQEHTMDTAAPSN